MPAFSFPAVLSMRPLLLMSLLCCALPATAETWQCQNRDLEIHCDAQHCRSNDNFTPISLTFDTQGTLEICAYSGCWVGKGRVLNRHPHLFISAPALAWQGTTPNPQTFMLAFDPHDQIALLHGGGFSMPLRCQKKLPW